MGSLRTSQRDTGFDPRNVPGCALWLDGADRSTLTLSGSSVSQWNDKSGNAYHATQSSSANRPVYTGSNIKFTSANQTWMDLNQSFGNRFLNNTAFNVFIVAFGGGSGFITGQVGNTSQNLFLGYGFLDTYQSTWYLQGSPSVPDSVNSINGFEYTGSVGTLYQNASSYATATKTLPLTSFSGPQIGRRYAGAGVVYHDHTFSEIIAYIGVVLTANQRQQVEGYLAWKWGLIPRFQNPLSISGCALWLDAADSSTLTFSGSNVTQWKDKSSNSYTASLSTSTRTTSNSIVIGGTSISIPNFTWRTKFTSFFVSKGGVYAIIDNRPTTNALMYIFTPNWSLAVVYTPSGGSVEIKDTLNAQGTSVVDAANMSILTIGYNNGTSLAPYAVNGTARASVTTSGTTAGDVNVTNTLRFNNVSSTELFECIIYNVNLTTTQSQQIEGYLADKWGLRSNLPAGFPAIIPVSHPFYRSVPSTRLITPLDIAGCTLWLDAADGTSMVLSGTKVTQWNDKSGNNRHATQSTTSLQPTYVSSSNCIRFAGASYLNMTDAFNMLSSSGRYYTAFVVEKRGAVGGAFPINGGGTGGSCLIMGYTGDTVWRHTTVAIVDLDYTVPGWQNPDPVRLWSGAYSGSIRDTYMNGTLGVSQSFSTTLNGWTEAMIGYLRVYNVNVYYSGDIYEMLFFNSYLSVADRQRIEGYLAWKWGLVGNIPTAHPHKSLPPFISIFTPPQISGLALWLDAADSSTLVLSGTNVSQWNDKSGVANHAIRGTTALGPTVTSANTLLFTRTSNSAQLLRTQYGKQTTQNVTFFLVIKSYNDNDGSIFDHRKAVNVQALHTIGSRVLTLRGTTSALITYNYVLPSTFSVVCLQSQSNLARLFVNGTLVTTQTGAFDMPAADAGFITIGALTDVPYQYWSYNNQYTYGATTEMGEVMMYNAYLSDAERQQVEGYLANKWGLRSSLPSTHPYIKERA